MIRIRQSSRCIFAFGCMNVLVCTLLKIHVLSNLELALAVSMVPVPSVPVAITLQHLLDSNDQHLDDTTHVLHFTCFRNDADADPDADSQSESVHVDVQSKGECCQQIIMATNEICSANANVNVNDNGNAKTKTSAALFPIDLCRQLLSTDDGGIDGVDNDQKSDESLVQQQCSLYAAQVPVPESIHSSPPLHVHVHVHVPVFYFNLALEGRFSFNSRSHAAMPDDADADADANDDSSQSPTKLNSHPLVQYNNYSGTWAQYDPVISPFQLEMALSDTTSTNDESPIISANLQSTISKEGGMHRAFRHLITLSTHNTPMHNHMHTQSHSQNNQGDGDGEGASLSSLSNAINVNGEVVFAMPLSQGVFLDMEDPFQLQLDGDAHRACRFDVKKFKAVNDHDHDHDHGNGRSGGDEAESLGLGLCLVEIKTAPGTVVDIEQPAFVSPQHVIMLHVTFQLDHLVSLVESELELELELEVVMNLHFRYPTTTKNHALPKFVPVHVPTPFLHTCSVSIESQQSDTHEKVTAHSDTFTYLVSDRLDKKIDDSRWNDGAMVDVAAGVDAHHDPVMAVTLMVSFIGAWCMLRDMSTVSVWR